MMQKYKIYTILALVLMSVCFTIPVIGFKGALEAINEGRSPPAHSYKIWNLYTSFHYKNHLIQRETRGDLSAMILQRAEIGVASFPVWRVSLEAPNYPKAAFPNGIPVYFHVDGYSGDVHEMNTINHYIGMYKMSHGGNTERAIAPYYLLISTILMIMFLYYDGRGNLLFLLPTILAPLLFIASFIRWLYWYGHNMQEWGAFKIKPFMPTALGDGQVAQFTTHSYPSIGFWVMICISVLSVLALFSKKKFLRQS